MSTGNNAMVGRRVKCINTAGDALLTLDEVYTVVGDDDGRGYYVYDAKYGKRYSYYNRWEVLPLEPASFKKGDKVVCVDAPYLTHLTLGEEYVLHAVDTTRPLSLRVMNDSGGLGDYYPARFEHAKTKKVVTKRPHHDLIVKWANDDEVVLEMDNATQSGWTKELEPTFNPAYTYRVYDPKRAVREEAERLTEEIEETEATLQSLHESLTKLIQEVSDG